jgi:low affinity Fe/Cu permease
MLILHTLDQYSFKAQICSMNKNEKRESLTDHFHEISKQFSYLMGTPWAFAVAAIIILLWLLSGPVFKYSDTWQLIINTGTTIITFLMVFLIQSTQNRDARALHLKLDELIRATKDARNSLLDLEAMTDEEMDKLQAEFDKLKNKRPGSGPR